MQPRDLFLAPHLNQDDLCAYLRSHGLYDPEKADRLIGGWAERGLPPSLLADFAAPLLEQCRRSADADALVARLDDLFSAAPGLRSFLSQWIDDPQAFEWLARLLAASSYIAETLRRNPEWTYWLTRPEHLFAVRRRDALIDLARSSAESFRGTDKALDALRRFRRREALRIAAQDVLRIGDVREITQQLSHLADAVMDCVYEILMRDFPAPACLAIMALGKLGGSELNFSSDIDIVFVHSQEDEPGALRCARRIVKALNDHSPEGRLYRVDLRLRPMGQSGEISYSIDAYRHYFQTWADTTDRLALLKCRAAAGDPALGASFSSMVKNFVYRRYIDLAAVEEIRWLKRRADRQAKSEGAHRRDLKGGPGGIREIEFFVQAFQLLYGGHHAELRTPSTLDALDRLVDRGLVTHGDYRSLKDTYILLRELEHKVQIAADRQTHALPQDERRLDWLARLMEIPESGEGVSPAASMMAELNRRRTAVHDVFRRLFEDQRLPEGFEEFAFNPDLRGPQAAEWLRQRGVERAEDVADGLRMLLDSPAFPHSPARLRNLVANLAPQLVRSSAPMGHPSRLFARLDRLAEAVGTRAGLYQELAENRPFAKRLFTILASSEYLSETLIRNAELLDALGASTVAAPSLEECADAFRCEATPLEREAVRRRKRLQEFKIAAAQIFGERSDRQCRAALSALAEGCVGEALRESVQVLQEPGPESFLILALGKLGGHELTYHSDLDLMLIFDDEAQGAALSAYRRLLKDLRAELEEYTDSGRAYRLDWRLRPEGRHSSPVVPLSALLSYFREGIAPWERLAYVKARPIGPGGLPNPLDSLLWERPFSEEEVGGLVHIRRRKENEQSAEAAGKSYNFKLGRGALLDLQFLVQCLQIQQGVREPGIRPALQALADEGVFSAGERTVLSEGLEFLFRLEACVRLVRDGRAEAISREPGEIRQEAFLLGFEEPAELLREYEAKTAAIRDIFDQRLGVG